MSDDARLTAALDNLDRIRMAAGEDFRMPVEQLVHEVARMFGVTQRAYQVAEKHPEEFARLLAWWICTAEGQMPSTGGQS